MNPLPPPELRCRKRIWHGWHQGRCQRKAVKGEFCTQHHPDTVKARDEARHAKWEAERVHDAKVLKDKTRRRNVAEWLEKYHPELYAQAVAETEEKE